MEPLCVHHVSINVREVEPVVEFFTKVLGATVRTDRPELGVAGQWLNIGDQQLHLIEAEVPSDNGQHFAIRVADLDGSVDELRRQGIEVTDPAPIGTHRQSFLHDPAGNRVELHEVPPGT